MQGIPDRNDAMTSNERGVEEAIAPSIIPPRKPKKLGMPKLQLPSRECNRWKIIETNLTADNYCFTKQDHLPLLQPLFSLPDHD